MRMEIIAHFTKLEIIPLKANTKSIISVNVDKNTCNYKVNNRNKLQKF